MTQTSYTQILYRSMTESLMTTGMDLGSCIRATPQSLSIMILVPQYSGTTKRVFLTHLGLINFPEVVRHSLVGSWQPFDIYLMN